MQTAHIPRDLLLSVARFIVGAIMGLLVFVGVCVIIGLGAVLTIQRNEMLEKLAAAGNGSSGFPLLIVAFVLIAAMMAIAFLFMRELFRIIGSVEKGDPFDMHNADRLRRMGWQTIASLMIFVAFAGVVSALGGDSQSVLAGDAIQAAFSSLLLALVLFILARVFRLGAAMRDELEGTV